MEQNLIITITKKCKKNRRVKIKHIPTLLVVFGCWRIKPYFLIEIGFFVNVSFQLPKG
jgi:hypothetical protein